MKTCPTCKSNFSGRPPRCPLDGSLLVDAGPDLLAGRVVGGRYRFVDLRGAGLTAEVYKTHDTKTGKVVAARLLTREHMADPTQRARLVEHEFAYKRVAPNPSLLGLLDVVEVGPDGRRVMITEWIDEDPLPQVLAAKPLAREAAMDVWARLAALLEDLHGRDVLARDLRAGAVFYSPTAALSVRVTIDALAPGPQLAPEPGALGPHVAPMYAAPERLRAEPLTAAADVYTLGVIAYEVLTGKPLFQGTAAEVLRQHLEAPPPVLRAATPTASAELEGLLARMLAKVPRFRPTAAEVAKALAAMRA